MNRLEIKNVTKIYNNTAVINNISFSVKEGEFLSILGPSGGGKTTLLKIIIGIENPTQGNIIKDNKDITKLDASKRGIGIVFQDYALFPNMTVLENVMYPLKLKIKDKNKSYQETIKILELVNMDKYINKYPHELSGGQKQRVAIARTLVLKPDVVLFDEPMSALDAENRLKLRMEIKRIQKKLKATIIYITHDQEEAFFLSDRVMVINNGEIQQIDVPSKIFNYPQNDFVEEFVTNHLKEKLESIKKCTGEIKNNEEE